MSKTKQVTKTSKEVVSICDFCDKDGHLSINLNLWHSGYDEGDSDYEHYRYCSWECFDRDILIIKSVEDSWWDMIDLEIDGNGDTSYQEELVRRLLKL